MSRTCASQLRPSHWAWAGTVKEAEEDRMLAVIAFDIGFLSRQTGRAGPSGHISLSHDKEGKPAGQALIQIKQTLRPSLMGINAVKKGFAEVVSLPGRSGTIPPRLSRRAGP